MNILKALNSVLSKNIQYGMWHYGVQIIHRKENGGKAHYYSPSPLAVVIIEVTVGSRDVCKDSLSVVPSLIR